MLFILALYIIPNVLRSNNSEGKGFGIAELIWTAEQFICEDVENYCVFLFSFGTFLFSLLAKKKKKSTRIDKQIKNNKMNPYQEILALIYSCGISILSLWRGELEGENNEYYVPKKDLEISRSFFDEFVRDLFLTSFPFRPCLP